MSALIPMEFDGLPVRLIQDVAGDPWFVAADVCAALAIGNNRDAIGRLDDDERDVVSTDTLGGKQEMGIINESGLYSLILGSRKPEAKRFKKWVTSEVLPSIRKTGSYSAKQSKEPGLRLVATEFKAALSIAKMVGLVGNQGLLSAAKAIERMHGIDPLKIMQITHLKAESPARHYNATELGSRVGESAIKFNQRLEAAGLQIKNINGHWQPTPKGEPHAVLTDTGKQHSNGTPVQQLRWLETVLQAAGCTEAA